jgi:hypothetical protein
MEIRKRQIHFFILLFAASSLLFHSPSDFEANAAVAWYNDSWENRKKITTSLNTEISSDLTNFPTLISFTDSDLTKTTESDGADIVFTASDGTTELAYEIERFDSSTGEIIAWVNIPTVSASENTDIYIYYKGIASTPSTVWDSNYKLVYHLNQTVDGTVDEITDASGTGNHGTAGGTGALTNDSDRITEQVEGKIGYGQKFAGPTETTLNKDGTGDFIWVDDPDLGVEGGKGEDSVTAEFWIKIADGGGSNVAIFGYHGGGNSNELLLTQANSLNLLSRGSALFDTTVDAATGEWTHIVVVYGKTGDNIVYQDGAEVASNSKNSRDIRIGINVNFALGGDIDNTTRVNNELIGDMDEFRISNTVRSADWAAASYANQNNSSSFLTIGTEGSTVTTATTSSTCTRHVILGNCGTIAINNDEYHIIDPWSIIPTTEVMVGEPVSITLSTPHNYVAGKINSVSVYTEIFGSAASYEESTHIYYTVNGDHYVSDHATEKQLFQVAGATHRIVQDTDVKNLEMFEVVFTMIFAKPMDTSHVVIETKNMHGISETIYLGNALKVIERPIELLTYEEKSKFEIISEPELKASLRPDMDIEPNMGILAIDPEPVVSKATCGNGTMLKDNLCVANEMSFYFFVNQFMRFFG